MLSRTQLRNHLEKLHENYLVEINRDAAESGSGDTYVFNGWGELGTAKVLENKDLFEDCFDPITGNNFIEAFKEQKKDLQDTGQDLTSGADTDISSATGGQRTLAGGSTRNVDLERHEEAVRAHCKDAIDGVRVENLDDVPVEGMIGLTDPTDPDDYVDIEETILDPTHGCWYQPDKPDDWVETESDARRNVKNAIRTLIEERVIIYDDVHETNKSGEAVDVTFAVLGEQDI